MRTREPQTPCGQGVWQGVFFRVAAAPALRAVSILKVIRGHVADSPQIRSRGPAGNAPFPHRPCIVLAILAASRHGETGRLQWRPSPASLPMGFAPAGDETPRLVALGRGHRLHDDAAPKESLGLPAHHGEFGPHHR